MLYRKIEKDIYQHFISKSDKILMLTGARQTGKSFIINHVASKIFKNVIEINLIEEIVMEVRKRKSYSNNAA